MSPKHQGMSPKHQGMSLKHQGMSPMGLFIAQFKIGASTSFESFVAIWTYKNPDCQTRIP